MTAEPTTAPRGPIDLVAARLNKGLTQRQLAARLGIQRTTIQRLEGGYGATPSNAKKVADFFDVQVSDLPGFYRERAA